MTRNKEQVTRLQNPNRRHQVNACHLLLCTWHFPPELLLRQLEIRLRARIAGLQAKRGFVAGDGLAGQALEQQDVAEVGMSLGVGGPPPDHGAKMDGGRCQRAPLCQDQSELTVRVEVIRDQAQGLGVAGLGSNCSAACRCVVASAGRSTPSSATPRS